MTIATIHQQPKAMRNYLSTRTVLCATLATLMAGWGAAARAQRGGQRPAPIERQAPAVQLSGPAPIERRGPGPMAGPKGHLNQWMAQHSNLSPAEQRLAMEREPGFQRLPPEEKQRLRDRFTQLEAMPPQKRQRMLARTEAMERLSPDQRLQVRGAMQQLGMLPMEQRQMVARSFRELRALPPEQRMAAMNSGRYQYLNGAQRDSLTNLIRVEPMLPPQ
jgi:hypothetical protein